MSVYDTELNRARAALTIIANGQAFITRRYRITEEVKEALRRIEQLDDEIVRNRQLQLTLNASSAEAADVVKYINVAQIFKQRRQERIEELKAEDQLIKRQAPEVAHHIAAAKQTARAVFDKLLPKAQQGDQEARSAIDSLNWMLASITVPAWH